MRWRPGIRSKTALPIVVMALVLGGFLFVHWLPDMQRRERTTQLDLVRKHMDSIVESLIPLMLSQQMDTIAENLSALKAKNPEWVDIRLTDRHGHQLFPIRVVGTPAPASSGILLDEPIRFLGDDIGHLAVRVNLAPAMQEARRQNLALLYTIGLLTAAMLVVMFVIIELAVTRPIRGLAVAAASLAKRDFDARLPAPSRDEVGSLVDSFSGMRHDLQTYQASLESELAWHRQAEQELKTLNQTLERRVEEEIIKSREKDHILIQQSRLASMGEMVHNIAHQWRQPLNTLALVLSNLKDDFHFGTLTEASLNSDIDRARRLLEKMSTTVDEFRDFFRPDREQTPFDLGEAIRQAISIVDATFSNNRIELVTELPSGLVALGFPAQFSQAILNILVNAKEAILSKERNAHTIRICLASQADSAVIEIEDSGGGMPPEVLERVFEPYFTTKEQGSGIGLYMAKMIIERNMNGRIAAENGEEGARFTITLPLSGAPGKTT